MGGDGEPIKVTDWEAEAQQIYYTRACTWFAMGKRCSNDPFDIPPVRPSVCCRALDMDEHIHQRTAQELHTQLLTFFYRFPTTDRETPPVGRWTEFDFQNENCGKLKSGIFPKSYWLLCRCGSTIFSVALLILWKLKVETWWNLAIIWQSCDTETVVVCRQIIPVYSSSRKIQSFKNGKLAK